MILIRKKFFKFDPLLIIMLKGGCNQTQCVTLKDKLRNVYLMSLTFKLNSNHAILEKCSIKLKTHMF